MGVRARKPGVNNRPPTAGRAVGWPGALILFVAALGACFVVGSGGCRSVMPGRIDTALPERFAVVRGQLVFHSDFLVAAHHRLLDQLVALRGELSRQLALGGSDEPIHVYLFESPERFNRFVAEHLPELPDRRAYFVETDTHLAVYAQWGDRVGEDLRHEVTHGYLHAAAPHLPLWLDEGLAEYYEVAPGRGGLNLAHLERLERWRRSGLWAPDLARLEAIGPTGELSQIDYAESWAWVHLMLHSSPQAADQLRRYLADLQQPAVAAEGLYPRLQRVWGDPGAVLVDHLSRLRAGIEAD